MENLLLAPSVEWLLSVGQTGMSVLLSFEVFDECRFSHVDGQFADVGYVIANSLQVFGDEKQPRVSRRGGRFAYHQFNQAMKNVVIEIVDLSVALNNLAG